MNVIAFVGKIVEVPTMRTSSLGNKYATMLVRVRRNFSNSEGVYEHDDLNMSVWKGIAETTCQVASAGDVIAVKGRLQSHTYEGKDGLQHLSYDLIAEQVSFLKKEDQV